jgi:hypothetical protein
VPVIHGDAGDDMHFLHARHSLFPFPAAIFADERPDRRGEVDEFGIVGMKDDFVDEGHMLLEPDIVRQPMLAAVGALVDGIPHCAGVDRGREFRVDS